jgi:hypothetical protein
MLRYLGKRAFQYFEGRSEFALEANQYEDIANPLSCWLQFNATLLTDVHSQTAHVRSEMTASVSLPRMSGVHLRCAASRLDRGLYPAFYAYLLCGVPAFSSRDFLLTVLGLGPSDSRCSAIGVGKRRGKALP